MSSSNALERQTVRRIASIANCEITAVGTRESPRDIHAEVEAPSLPPPDHGRQAYLVLLGCTLIQAPIWGNRYVCLVFLCILINIIGYSLSFGVFQGYYTTSPASPFFAVDSAFVATVGTTLNGLMYLMMPITFTVLTRYPGLRPYCGSTGLLIATASLIMSSFATHIWQLLVCQGILGAIGSGLLFAPTTLYLDEWFIARKGIAYGTLWAGKALAGCIFPFLMSSLLLRFGACTTLRIWAISLVIITSPLLVTLKPRIPHSTATARRPLDWRFLKITSFWMLQVGNICQALGYLLPTTYLTSYAHDLGLPRLTGAILIAVCSLGSVLGSLVTGFLNDRLTPTTVILLSSLGSTLAVLIFWGLSSGIALLSVFAIFYGFFAGGFSSTYPGILHEMRKEDRNVDTGLVMGLLLGGRGIGFLMSGPVSGGLMKSALGEGGTLGYDTQYGPIIVATGVTALFGSWGWMWKMLGAVMALTQREVKSSSP